MVMCQPPSTARSDHSPYTIGNGAQLLAYPDGDVLSGPGSADDGPGARHRPSRRPGGLRRPLHRAPGAQRARPAKRAEQPGISWGRVGPARLSGRPKRSMNALIPTRRPGSTWPVRAHEPASPGPGSPPRGPSSGPR